MSDDLRPVVEFKDVFVNRQGRVFTLVDGEYKELPRTRDVEGNCQVAIRVNGRSKKRFVNKMVIEAFGEAIGLDPRQYLVMHGDGDRFNCKLENLTVLKRSPMAGRVEEIDGYKNRNPMRGKARGKV